MARPRPVVGLFVEGTLRDRTRNSIDKLWKLIAERCGADVELRVYGIDKSQILALRPDAIPPRNGATRVISTRPRLDAEIDRAMARDGVTNVIIAFDALPPNELLAPLQSCMRTEIAFVLDGLAMSGILPAVLRDGAQALAFRYRQERPLSRRQGRLDQIEILYMDPLFEALLAADEVVVRNALGHSSYPKDWPKFKTRERQLDKFVLVPAVERAHKDVKRKIGGSYLDCKAAWGCRILEHGADSVALRYHPISARLCRLLRAA